MRSRKTLFSLLLWTILLLRHRFHTTVDEVAALVTYVAGGLSSATTGAALRVDGGVVRAIVRAIL